MSLPSPTSVNIKGIASKIPQVKNFKEIVQGKLNGEVDANIEKLVDTVTQLMEVVEIVHSGTNTERCIYETFDLKVSHPIVITRITIELEHLFSSRGYGIHCAPVEDGLEVSLTWS